MNIFPFLFLFHAIILSFLLKLHMLVDLFKLGLIGLYLFLLSVLQLVEYFPRFPVLHCVPQEVRLGDTPLHPADGLEAAAVFLLRLIDGEQGFLELVELLKLLHRGADEWIAELEVWVSC
jgi:hypothetical protein